MNRHAIIWNWQFYWPPSHGRFKQAVQFRCPLHGERADDFIWRKHPEHVGSRMAGCGVTWCLVAVIWAQYFVGTVHTAFKPVHPDYYYSTQVQEAVRFAFSKINTESNGGPFGIVSIQSIEEEVQYIPRNMYTVFALLCFVVVIHWLIFPYPSGLLHWHCGNLTIAPVPAKQPWWIWINTSFEFIINDYITTTKQSTTKPCAYFLGYTVCHSGYALSLTWELSLSIHDWDYARHS